ncbi:TetR/AcrR family transcriptional regulator [Edaphobacter sp. 12200R-103]|jgi:AcrR family transcriptional regulator|uniref:TetR/AcrR family transcriptional regulator n=1 Tax=Edaphobacter sp. 12200R-103 TaxID=2703788 RepID=UPI00138D9CBA|nr:TetR/AcrR family transcriptional regulator [Edaphobacter sp. 12200R-103]QHS52839.1 TetR/AcrR family transcriptional regulator [Edaphobacter sp. 12200R-103]
MSQDSHETPSRKPRADALRNRERILDVARAAFTGFGADVSLDDIARQAGVGPGTLYRHFPTREALLEAVYRTEVEKLAAAEREFATTMPPVDALRKWMGLFVDYMATKLIIVPALNTMAGSSPKVMESSGELIRGAINRLVTRAVESGDLRPDLDPLDLLRALAGISNVAPVADWPQSAKKMVDILILGSRPTP